MIKAYWTRIVLFALVGAAIALVASKFIPTKYEADVELMVDQTTQDQPTAASNQDTATVDLTSFSRPRNIVTQVEQLQSLGVLTIAAQKVAEKNGFSDPTKDPNSELNPVNLHKALSVNTDQNSDMIEYEIRLHNAELAQEVAQEIYQAFVQQNEDNSKALAQRAIASLRTQTAIIEGELKTIDAKITDLKSKSGYPDPTSQITAEINGLAQLKQQRDAAAIEQAGSRQQVEVLTQELARTPERIEEGVVTTTNPVWEKLETDLISAQADRAALLTMYLPDNDMVQAADDKIKSIKSELDRQPHTIPAQSSKGLNQSYIALQSQLATAKATADGADKKVVVADQQVTEREKFLQTLPPIQAELASLARQQQSLEKVYLGYQDSLKTLEAAKEGRTSPTQEISPAMAYPDPVSPKVWINVMLGALVGLLCGIVSMQFAEAKRQPVRSLAQLNGIALNPVYRMIPELRAPFRGLDKAPPESFESLLVNFLRSHKRPFRVAVVGVNKDSGASTAAVNLAIGAMRHGARALLVQCDPKGALGRIGHRDAKPGHPIDLKPQLRAVTATSVLTNSANQMELSGSILSLETDLTVIDLEPSTRSAEYAFVAPHVDEVILLVRAGRCRSVEFLQAQQALREAGCKKITVVFTRSSDFSVVVDAVEAPASRPIEAPLPAWTPAKEAEPNIAEMREVAVEPPVQPEPQAPEAEPVVAEEPPTTPMLSLAHSEPKPEPTPDPGFSTSPEPVIKVSNGPSESEVPLRAPRTSPNVSIEDFGGIIRAKMPPAPEKAPEKPAKSQRSRRSEFDTSEIDS